MRFALVAFGLLGLLLLAGCDRSRVATGFGSPADQKATSHYVELLRAHDYAAIEKDLDPAIGGAGVHETFVRMAAVVPAGPPLSVKTVGVRTSDRDGVHTSEYTYEYQYPHRWLLINAVVRKVGGRTTLAGMHVKLLDASLEAANRFTLVGKSPLQYAVLVAALLVPLVCIYALVMCARMPIRGRKWPWMLFILFGVGTLSVNWTTGAWTFDPVSAMALGVGTFQLPYGPWTLSVAFPLGAVWFLLRRRHLLERIAPPPLPAGGGA